MSYDLQYEPHQQRVVEEFKQLNERYIKLNVFIASNPVFHTLPEEEKADLVLQRSHMERYLEVLNRRISRFPKAKETPNV